MKLYIKTSQLNNLLQGKQSGAMVYVKPIDKSEHTVLLECDLVDGIQAVMEENKIFKARLKKIKDLADD